MNSKILYDYVREQMHSDFCHKEYKENVDIVVDGNSLLFRVVNFLTLDNDSCFDSISNMVVDLFNDFDKYDMTPKMFIFNGVSSIQNIEEVVKIIDSSIVQTVADYKNIASIKRFSKTAYSIQDMLISAIQNYINFKNISCGIIRTIGDYDKYFYLII
ncbi:hypothetical protein WA158_004335 [Blastocystis sp. Blastoise]